MSQESKTAKALQVVDNAPTSLGVFPQMATALHNSMVVLSTEFDHGMDRINTAGERMRRVMAEYDRKITAFTDSLEKQMEENFKE